MTQTAINYGKALFELEIPREAVEKAERIIKEVPQILEVLDSPLRNDKQTLRIIQRVFPKELEAFLGVVCRYKQMALLPDMLQAYKEFCNQKNHSLTAVLSYAKMPQLEQLLGIRKALEKQYHAENVILELKEDKKLVSGFVIRINSQEMDYSLRGRILALQQKLERRGTV